MIFVTLISHAHADLSYSLYGWTDIEAVLYIFFCAPDYRVSLSVSPVCRLVFALLVMLSVSVIPISSFLAITAVSFVSLFPVSLSLSLSLLPHLCLHRWFPSTVFAPSGFRLPRFENSGFIYIDLEPVL